ncbi:carboxypeptidase-like regulatory domain-containing protein [Chryseobacterium candidae]|uniref:Carboxypeptidase regulatory-like domain-containing protein n=1 Tax=Chryseobacterium candidae TaxID=1978493 RepID=A0ABY2R355_9FLAO|nr:carboxypeptidase-like regulatory domain-containing protein [Chryseobacterium candidae]THV56062.1 hypothetical protein EK417_20510 [Chryseobacterium candidae]
MEIRCIKRVLFLVLFCIASEFWGQQKISGNVITGDDLDLAPVLVVNISENRSVLSDMSGKFEIEAKENDEIRFVKEGYYRVDKKLTREEINAPFNIMLKKMEIQIPEVTIKYRPTGDLAKDNQHYNESRKLQALKSDMEDYMRSPLNQPLPDNTVSKTFTGHDFNAGQVNLFGVFNAVKKLAQPKVTKANYNETQDFLKRVRNEVNLNFLKKYGMDEEQIDAFLLYADKTRSLAKRYRKDFSITVVEYELKVAFGEYSKTHKLEGTQE